MAVFKIRTASGWMEVPIEGDHVAKWNLIDDKPFSTLGPKFTVVNGELNVNTDIELVPVDTLPEASASTMGKIYLVPATKSKQKNIKDEYVTVKSGEEGSYTYSWEQIGSTAIELTWDTIENKPFSSIGDGLKVEDNVLKTENPVPAITTSTVDLEDGVSPLPTGSLYFVYEE